METEVRDVIGEVAYNAWLEAFGTVVPPWEVLPPEHKEAWKKVAEKVQLPEKPVEPARSE